MAASWLQVTVDVPPPALDAVANFLMEMGSPGIVFAAGGVTAFFSAPAKRSRIEQQMAPFLRELGEIHGDFSRPHFRYKTIKDRNWNSSWRKFFSPQKVGERLWITPPWAGADIPRGRSVITIEPGMAFGTGTHATTRCCLEFIENLLGSSGERKVTALDVGTGSGILAIALAKLGAKQVLALDRDPAALKAARANVRLNGVQGAVRVSGTPLESVRGSYSIIVANLTAEAILDLAEVLPRMVSDRGHLILSGILRGQANEVKDKFCRERLKLQRRKNRQEWAALLLQSS